MYMLYYEMRMRLWIVILIVTTSLVWADVPETTPTSAYGYLKNHGIPRAADIRKAEEKYSRYKIVGGVPAGLGQYPSQAGLIGDIPVLNATAVCGGSLISSSRVVTAAHCWNDGINQVSRFTIVLGSTLIFSGGTRLESTVVASHPNWTPMLARNDIAVIYLPNSVSISNIIAPIALPTGSEVIKEFVGESAIAVGFGITADGKNDRKIDYYEFEEPYTYESNHDATISPEQSLSHVRLRVISNSVCSFGFPFVIQPTHICTSSFGGNSICSGDSGGPLIATWNSRQILIGVSSFVSARGCESNLPAAFARVTSFLFFINSHL